MSFENKVVWITGASSGIGEGLAHAFHQRGAMLVLSSRRETELERVKSELKGTTDNVLILPLDLEQVATLNEKADTALEHFGQIDILVNNGGISQRALTKDTPLDVDRRIMEIDYFGTIALTKAVLPSMLERKSGHVVTISSLAGKIGTPMRSAYCASKHALHGFFDSLRAEVWEENIYVALICPGYVSTQISVNALTATGNQFSKMDQAVANGMPPDVFAQHVLRAIEQRRVEVIIGTPREKLIVFIRNFAPKFFSRMIRNAVPK